MRYVARDGAGQVVAVSLVQDVVHPEALAEDAPELASFARGLPQQQGPLADSDLRLVRVLEDLIDLLIDKEVIRFTDLPAPAQEKLMERRSLRHSLQGLKLIDDSEVL
jgi:hypothetical protein